MSAPRPGAHSVRAAWAVLVVLIGAVLASACQREPELPTYWQRPDFALRDQFNQPASADRFEGRVVLANFIFTNCADTCPLLTASMRSVQDRLKSDNLFGNKVQLASFSVDPERDSPEALARYGEAVGADFGGWTFMTGERVELEQVLIQGFKLPFRGPPPPGPAQPGFEITHTNRVVLIDAQGQIRGLLNGEEVTVGELLRDIRRLVR